jgi:hypothetical protein
MAQNTSDQLPIKYKTVTNSVSDKHEIALGLSKAGFSSLVHQVPINYPSSTKENLSPIKYERELVTPCEVGGSPEGAGVARNVPVMRDPPALATLGRPPYFAGGY